MAEQSDLQTGLLHRRPYKTHVTGLVLIALGAFVAALFTRVGLISHPLIYDELYQYMPAVSWQDSQTFAVLDGVYDRAARFTKLIALSFDITGSQSAFSARLIPVVMPGALLVAMIVTWAYHVGGAITAATTCIFLLFWPNGIEVSQYIRFYSMQGALFVAGALLVYAAVAGSGHLAWRLIMLAGSAILFLVALDLQMLTALGVGAIGIWVLLSFAPGWLHAHPRLWWLVGALLAASGGVLLSGTFSNEIRWLWTTYNWEPWPHLNDTTFYHRYFRDNYPTFWPLFPVAAIIALRANFLPASFCLILFATTFVLQSFGGLKGIRYLYPTMPFFFVLWGIALQALLPSLWTFLKDAATKALSFVLPQHPLKEALAWGMLVVAAGFLIFANPAFLRSTKLILGKDDNMLVGKTRWQWTDAQPLMAPWLAQNALIVTDEEMRAIEWLGDFDLGYNKPRFSELLYSIGPDTQPFTIDRRTGRPLIGEYDDFQHVVLCHPVGVYITNQRGIQNQNIIRLLQDIQGMNLDVTLETGRGVSLMGWQHRPEMVPPGTCSRIPGFAAPLAAARILSGQSTPQTVSSVATER